MKNQDKHIDDLFRECLGCYTEAPPPAMWDALQKRLDDATPKCELRGWYVIAWGPIDLSL